MSQTTAAPKTKILSGLQAVGVLLLIAGAVLAGLGLSQAGFTGKEIAKSYFFGWMFWTSLTFGCTGLALLHHVVRAKWTSAMFRIWEAGGGWQMLLLMGIGFIPVAVLGPEIYKWMRPEVIAVDKMIADKTPYLNQPFFIIRAVVYFGVMAWAMWFLSGLKSKEEKTGDKKFSDQRNWVAPPMLAAYVLFINFAMTDWGMSLDPHWFSTIYGIWLMNGMGIMALAFGILVIGTQGDKAPFAEALSKPLLKDIGHMMLALSMVWAYFSLSQYLIIWSGNLPEFTPYYLARSANGFNALGMANIVGSFVIPFLLLVGPWSPNMKIQPKGLAFVAGWVLVFRLVDFNYIFSPSLRPGNGIIPTMSDFGMLLLFGGIWLVVFALVAKQKPLTAESHPYQAMKDPEAAHA
jgi:hypothetical protein